MPALSPAASRQAPQSGHNRAVQQSEPRPPAADRSSRLNRSILRAALALLLCAAPALAEEPAWRHGVSLLGEPKYPADFPHFDYVNPDAPKGGLVRFGAQGTFDNFNLFVAGIKGELENGAALVYDTLMEPAGDEVATEYGLLAEAVRHPDDFSSVTYRLRGEARWHDGRPVTPADVIFSFETLRANSPVYAFYYRNVTKAEATGEREITFSFSEGRQPRAAADRRPDSRPAEALVGGRRTGRPTARSDADHAGDAARLRPLPPEELRDRPHGGLRARAGLLGPRPQREPRAQQSRRDPLRVLPGRRRAARSLQGRPARLAHGERRPQLGDRLRDPGPEGGPDRQGGVRAALLRDHAGLRLQPAPAEVSGRAGAAGLQPRLRFRGHQPHPVLRALPAGELLLLRHRARLLRPAAKARSWRSSNRCATRCRPRSSRRPTPTRSTAARRRCATTCARRCA